jgi:RNA polymerase sigma-70 factor, ECF subfamily
MLGKKTSKSEDFFRLTDEELMAKYKGGDAEAINELINRHGQRLYGFLVRQTGSRDRAEDVYQEVFLRVIKAAPRFKPNSHFTAWLYTIARNIIIDEARKNKHRKTESLDQSFGDASSITKLDLIPDKGPNPEENLRGIELANALEEGISKLSKEQREVLLLRERVGLSFKEIANVTDTPLNTVKTRMHYALGHLRKGLSEEGFLGEGAK